VQTLGREPALADSAGRRLLSDQQLITMFGPRIRRLARRFVCDHLPSLELEDLEANGIVAMLRAANRYRVTKSQAPFGAYVQRRLVGTMQDTLRQEGRQAKRGKLARAEETGPRQTGVEGLATPADGRPAGETAMLGKLLHSAIAATLTKRQHRAVRLLYIERLTLRQAGDRLNVGESRMCQIHSEAGQR
jgi:RNA polymerase sigma factor (sigma-70 family)